MSCIERLVHVWKEVQVTPPPIQIVHLQESKVVAMMESLADEDWMDSGIILDGLAYKTEITDALNKMRDTLWEAAGELEATHIQTWKISREFISGLTGLELYYTVAMRELIAAGHPSMIPTGSAVPSVEVKRKREPVPSLREQHARLKEDVDRLLKADEKQRPALEAMSIGYRRVLARHFRDLGNTAYTMSDYVIANGLYTRAIGYDAEDPIYPLNRAACRIKLKCFSSAETDCSSALSMDPSNYKAFFRRGVSKVGQGRYEQAKRDFEEVLKLQKHNPAALKELKELEAKRLAGQGGQAKADGSRAPTKKSTTSISKSGKGKVSKPPAAASAAVAIAPSEDVTASKSPVVDIPRAEELEHSPPQPPTPVEGSPSAQEAEPISDPIAKTMPVCEGPEAAVEEVFLPATSCAEPVKEPEDVSVADHKEDAPAPEDKPEDSQPNRVYILPETISALSKTAIGLANDVNPFTDAEEAEDYRAHAARVARLLDGLQHCKANMESADVATRKEAIASASQLVKEFEATECESRALTQKVVKRTEQLTRATAKITRPRSRRAKASHGAKAKIEEVDPDAPGASETSEQRKARLDKETRDQLYFTWAFILIVQQKTGARLLKSKSQLRRPGGILIRDDTYDVPVPEPVRRDSDSGIERSPVAKARRKIGEKASDA
jgi:tetratricopeptide (TPR) repeat protein